MSTRPLIHQLFETPMSGEDIERRSFDYIEECLPESMRRTGEFEIARRLVHAAGDTELPAALRVSSTAVEAGVTALRSGAPIVVDAQMIRAGLSLPRLRRVSSRYCPRDIVCHIADKDVAEAAAKEGLPRALFALRKASARLNGAVAVFGNSPVALLELNRLIIEEGIKPALVIGFPVGFIHVTEAKEELATLDVPSIILDGNRGGSPLAVAALHAMAGLAEQSSKERPAAGEASSGEAIILLGHGSRVPGAGSAMDEIAEALRARLPLTEVFTCHMSRLGPHFPETFERAVRSGARRVTVLPYFLHTGLHIQLDIPEMLKESAEAHPDVALVLGEPLGFHDGLVSIVEERARAAEQLPDIRQVTLPARDLFPVPPGQEEFVPMSPEAAQQWRRHN